MNADGLVGMLMDVCEGLVRSGDLHSGLWATSHCVFVMYFAAGQCQGQNTTLWAFLWFYATWGEKH